MAAMICSLLLAGKENAAASEKTSAVTIGDYAGPKATLLAIDDYALPLRSNLCCYISKPTVRAEPVLTPSHGKPHATYGVE